MSRKPRPSEIAQTIERAADYIQTNGWRRTTEWDSAQKGKVPADMVGALYQVTRYDNRLDWAYFALDRYLYEMKMPPPGTWNMMQRDRRKVIRNMRRCARQLRSGELSVTTEKQNNYPTNR